MLRPLGAEDVRLNVRFGRASVEGGALKMMMSSSLSSCVAASMTASSSLSPIPGAALFFPFVSAPAILNLGPLSSSESRSRLLWLRSGGRGDLRGLFLGLCGPANGRGGNAAPSESGSETITCALSASCLWRLAIVASRLATFLS